MAFANGLSLSNWIYSEARDPTNLKEVRCFYLNGVALMYKSPKWFKTSKNNNFYVVKMKILGIPMVSIVT